MSNFDWSVAGERHFAKSVASDPADGSVIGTGPFYFACQVENALTVFDTGPQGDIPGAVSEAGIDARVGNALGRQLDVSGGNYFYNTPGYFPGTFLSADMVNGGPPLAAPQEATLTT